MSALPSDVQEIVPVFGLIGIDPCIIAVIAEDGAVRKLQAPFRLYIAQMRVAHADDPGDRIDAVLLELLHQSRHVLDTDLNRLEFDECRYILHIIGDLAVVVLDVDNDRVQFSAVHIIPEGGHEFLVCERLRCKINALDLCGNTKIRLLRRLRFTFAFGFRFLFRFCFLFKRDRDRGFLDHLHVETRFESDRFVPAASRKE